MHNHSYENEFNLLVNEISFSYEKMGTKTRFDEEAKGNSEMAYSYFTTSTADRLLSLMGLFSRHRLRPCIRLARVKFELTNQDSAGGKNFTALTSM